MADTSSPLLKNEKDIYAQRGCDEESLPDSPTSHHTSDDHTVSSARSDDVGRDNCDTSATDEHADSIEASYTDIEASEAPNADSNAEGSEEIQPACADENGSGISKTNEPNSVYSDAKRDASGNSDSDTGHGHSQSLQEAHGTQHGHDQAAPAPAGTAVLNSPGSAPPAPTEEAAAIASAIQPGALPSGPQDSTAAPSQTAIEPQLQPPQKAAAPKQRPVVLQRTPDQLVSATKYPSKKPNATAATKTQSVGAAGGAVAEPPARAQEAIALETAVDDSVTQVQMQADVKYAQRLQEQEDAWHAAVLSAHSLPSQSRGWTRPAPAAADSTLQACPSPAPAPRGTTAPADAGLFSWPWTSTAQAPAESTDADTQAAQASMPAPISVAHLHSGTSLSNGWARQVEPDGKASAGRDIPHRQNATGRHLASSPVVYTWHHPAVSDGNLPAADLMGGTLRHEEVAPDEDREDIRYASRIQLLEQVQHARHIKATAAGLPAAVQRNGRCIIDIRLPKVYSVCDPVWGWRGTVLYHHILRRLQREQQERLLHQATAAGAARGSADPEVQALAQFAGNTGEAQDANPFFDSSAQGGQPAARNAASALAPRSLSQAQSAQRQPHHSEPNLDDETHARYVNSPVNPEVLCCFMVFPCVWCGPLPDRSICLASSAGGCQRTIGTCSFWMGLLSCLLFVVACILDDYLQASLTNSAAPEPGPDVYSGPTFSQALVGLPTEAVRRVGAFYAGPDTSGVVDGAFRFLTALFVPSGMVHLLLHLAVLWRVGPILEHLWGSYRFLLVYIGGGLMALLFEAAVFRQHLEIEQGVICATSFGDMAMLSVWMLYLFMENGVQHKQQRSGNCFMLGILLYAALLTGLSYLLPFTGSGLACGCAVVLAPVVYVMAFNNLNMKEHVTFGTADDVWLRSEVGPGLHLLVPDGTRARVRRERRLRAAALHQTEGDNEGAQSGNDAQREESSTSPVGHAVDVEAPAGRRSGRRLARLQNTRQRAPLCEECVFVCPAAVRLCGCHRVWGMPTVASAALLLGCLLALLAIALQW